MIQLLSPIWLWALVAVSIPLLLHLLSRKSGKRIPVGSVQLLREATSHRLRQIKLSEILLLFCRMGLLIFLSLLLTKPLWMEPDTTALPQSERWVLIEPERYPGQQRPNVTMLVDSLVAAGYDARAFAPGFPPVGDGSETLAGGISDAWALIRELDLILPPGSQVVVIATPTLASFVGQRPGIRFDLDWRNSSGPGDFAGENPAQKQEKISRRIVLYNDNQRREDARYIRSALTTLTETTPYDFILSVAADTAQPAPDADVIIWLSSRQPPDGLTTWVDHEGRILIADGFGDRYDPVNVPIKNVMGDLIPGLKLSRMHPAPSVGAPIWTSGHEQPVLQVQPVGSGLFFQFNSRFHPAWGDWVTTGDFPTQLAKLLTRNSPVEPAYHVQPETDPRRIDKAQLLPRQVSPPADQSDFRTLDLHYPVLILVVTLLIIERWLSRRRGV